MVFISMMIFVFQRRKDAERFCGGTEDIRIKTVGKQIPYGNLVKFAADLCAHYKILPTQAAVLEKIEKLGGGRSEGYEGTRKDRKARKRAKRGQQRGQQ